MTLEPYDPQRLDALALRVLDICLHLRGMARTCREESLTTVELHDRKPLEWLEKLEGWAIGAAAELQGQALKHRGTRLARSRTKSR